MSPRALDAARPRPADIALLKAFGIILFAVATAAGAQLRIPIPGTPVPITLQVFFAILAGMILGARAGAASQVLCLVCGASGLPFFAGGGFGLLYLGGPTGGYLLSFPLAAAAAGAVSVSGGFLARLAACSLAVLVIYACGACWLALSLSLAPMEALEAGVLPFVLADAAKAVIAAGTGRAVMLIGSEKGAAGR
jgi:biotin transport system substrate-specific component